MAVTPKKEKKNSASYEILSLRVLPRKITKATKACGKTIEEVYLLPL